MQVGPEQHVGIAVVILRSHPAIEPISVGKSSTIYRLQVPFGSSPLNTLANVAAPAVAGSWKGPAGAGAGNRSPVP